MAIPQEQGESREVGPGRPPVEYQWKKGQSGNPGGMKKGATSLTARLRALLDATELGGKPLPNGKQVADLVAEVILKAALKGDHRFVSTLLDRVDGKATAPEPDPDDVKNMSREELERIVKGEGRR